MIKQIEVKPITYREYWVARVVQTDGITKTVINEVFFESGRPTEQEIVDVLINSPSNCFVSVVHNYELCDPKDAKKFVF